MRKQLVRLAVAAAGTALALGATGTAWAADLPAGVPLKDTHRGHTAGSGDWPEQCAAGEFNGVEVPEGYDGWHFVLPASGGPGAHFTALYLAFDGDEDYITVDGDGADDPYVGWIREDNARHAFLFTPAGWTLTDGAAEVAGGSPSEFVVSHACPGQPGDDDGDGDGDGDEGDDGRDDEGGDTGGDTGGEGGTEGDQDEVGLPVTGTEIGTLAIVGAGLLVAGIATTLLVRRKRTVAGLDDS